MNQLNYVACLLLLRKFQFQNNFRYISKLLILQTDIPLIFIQGDMTTSYTRELASLMRSVAVATVPKITLITGNTTGHAYLAMVCFIP